MNTLSELRQQPWCQPPTDPEPEFVPNGCDETLYGRKGRRYRGCQTQTIGGYECQPWMSQFPHAHAQTEDRFIDETLEEAGNYCRNPDGGDTIWCYTTDPEKRWEYCQPAPVNAALCFVRLCFWAQFYARGDLFGRVLPAGTGLCF